MQFACFLLQNSAGCSIILLFICALDGAEKPYGKGGNAMAGNALDKVKGLFTEIKTHWSTPAEGKYVPYREYKDIFIAVGSNYAGSKLLEARAAT